MGSQLKIVSMLQKKCHCLYIANHTVSKCIILCLPITTTDVYEKAAGGSMFSGCLLVWPSVCLCEPNIS